MLFNHPVDRASFGMFLVLLALQLVNSLKIQQDFLVNMKNIIFFMDFVLKITTHGYRKNERREKHKHEQTLGIDDLWLFTEHCEEPLKLNLVSFQREAQRFWTHH